MLNRTMAIARIDCYSSISRSGLRRGAVFLVDDFNGMLERIVNWGSEHRER